ncbi:MAG: RsmF rRNA methyltransferase first C-terminal domain-containing protein [Clostridiales bacterium]|jgi:NOL1/NOP2/sun family putative RNA methylase|nr:RsmF rRNA methyltransferase first C-terminal domain-containing protein [Clostridiales bacterium]
MALPAEFLERMRKQLGGGFAAFAAEYGRERTRGLRVNTLKISKAEFTALQGSPAAPVPWCDSGLYAEDGVPARLSPLHTAGLFYMQEPSAMAAAIAVSPGETDRVLDLCAAPGGKSTHLSALMRNNGVLVANEIVPKRAKILSENIERLGVTNAIVTNEAPERLCAKFEKYFDKILVDAPCSGEGMFRKNPAAAEEWSPALARICARRQLLILESAKSALKDGGELVYATCTFAPEENEGVVAEFLRRNDAFFLADAHSMYPHTHKCEGHFIAKIRHKGEKKRSEILFRPSRVEELGGVTRDTEFPNVTRLGGHLWSVPEQTDLAGIRFLRYGLHLGEYKKNRFQPSHSLCMSGRGFCQTLDAEGGELAAYLRGETLRADGKGWIAVRTKAPSAQTPNRAAPPCKCFNIGLGKAGDGVLKNHLPKNLRVKN